MKTDRGDGVLEPADFEELFEQAAAQTDVAVDPALIGAFFSYWRELQTWNRRINLTSIRDPGEVIARHFIDSLALLPALNNAKSLLDIGSGAGFPGMVVAIAMPGLDVHLAESVQKKAHFLTHLRRTLGLKNVTVHPTRAETLDQAMTFDMATGRAVREPILFAGLAGRFLAPSGRVAIFTAGSDHPEIDDFSIDRVIRYRLPFGAGERLITIWRKNRGA